MLRLMFSRAQVFLNRYPVARGMVTYSFLWPTGCLIQQSLVGTHWSTWWSLQKINRKFSGKFCQLWSNTNRDVQRPSWQWTWPRANTWPRWCNARGMYFPRFFFAIACDNLCLLRGGRRPLNTLAKETFMNESICFLCFVYRGLRLDEMLSVFRVRRIHRGALTLLLDSAGLHDVARPNAPIGDSEGWILVQQMKSNKSLT